MFYTYQPAKDNSKCRRKHSGKHKHCLISAIWCQKKIKCWTPMRYLDYSNWRECFQINVCTAEAICTATAVHICNTQTQTGKFMPTHKATLIVSPYCTAVVLVYQFYSSNVITVSSTVFRGQHEHSIVLQFSLAVLFCLATWERPYTGRREAEQP